MHRNPFKKVDPGRVHNLAIVSVLADKVVNEPDPDVAGRLLVGQNIDQKTNPHADLLAPPHMKVPTTEAFGCHICEVLSQQIQENS